MEKTNVVLLILDAVRTDSIGSFGSRNTKTPNIDSLCENGIKCPNAFSCINTTDPSLTTLYTGKFPINHGLINHGAKVSYEEVKNLKKSKFLSEILKENGYSTAAVDWLGRWHKRGYDYYTGFQPIHNYAEESQDKDVSKTILKLLEKSIEPLPQKIQRTLRGTYRKYVNPLGDKSAVEDARTTTDLALKTLDKLKNPYFLLVHYWDAHFPYNPPKEFIPNKISFKFDESLVENNLNKIKNTSRKNYIKEEFEEGIKNAIKKYYGSINYMDHEIGRLLDSIDENTIVVILSDHGKSLIEHGIFFDHHGLYDVNIRTPLIFGSSGFLPSNKDINGFVQTCDILPSLLYLLDINFKENIDGVNIFDSNFSREYIHAEETQTQRGVST